MLNDMGISAQLSQQTYDIDELAKCLKRSPLFNLSLGSRELFHSNFLAWLFETYSSSLFASLGKDDTSRPVEFIRREYLNMDLIIQFQDGGTGPDVIVIENKVKDIPRVSQFIEYDEKLERKFPGKNIEKILLSPLPPSAEVESLTEWKYINYEDLGRGILNWGATDQGLQSHPDNKAIVFSYASMVITLSHFLSEAFGQSGLCTKHWFLNDVGDNQKKVMSALKRIRFEDTVKKLQAANLLSDVNSKAVVDETGLSRASNYGITDKTPFLEVSLKRKLRKGWLRLGVQVQGYQYRRFVDFSGYNVPPRQSSGRKYDELAKAIGKTDGYKWLISPELERKGWIKPKFPIAEGPFSSRLRTKLRYGSPINSYTPSFIYQHVEIDPNHALGTIVPETVVSTMAMDILYARTLLIDPEYISAYES